MESCAESGGIPHSKNGHLPDVPGHECQVRDADGFDANCQECAVNKPLLSAYTIACLAAALSLAGCG